MVRLLLVVAALGAVARVVLWACSDGTNDVDGFRYLARENFRIGLPTLYQHKYGVANHPPLAMYFAAAALWVSDRIGVAFPMVMKIPMLLADTLVALLLWRIWASPSPNVSHGAWPPQRTRLLAAIAVAAYAWNLDAILLSAFHCNTDPIYAALCLLAIYLIERRGLNFVGGLVLAAAMNVKVIPLLLVAPLLLQYRSIRPALWFLAGIAVGLVSFYPFFYLIPQSFWRNVFSYKPVPSLWGFNYFLIELIFNDIAEPYARTVIDRFSREGRWLIMGVMVLLGLIARRRQWTRFELTAAAMAAFLVLTPGFGVQYTVLIVPMLCAVSPWFGLAYGTAAGVFIGAVYWVYRIPGYPIASRFTGGIPESTAVLGLFVWIILIVYLARQLRSNPPARRKSLFTPIPSTPIAREPASP